ncbi:MAG: ester cyclase [Acidimicrobiales bacterium]
MGNSDTVRGMYELFGAGDLDGFFDHIADDFVDHENGPAFEPTKAGTRQLFAAVRAAFPDLRFAAEDVLESGDKVVARARVTGTNKGDFRGIPASGKSIDVQAIDILRFGADGLVHEHWGVMDIMSMMQQIGAVPQGAST